MNTFLTLQSTFLVYLFESEADKLTGIHFAHEREAEEKTAGTYFSNETTVDVLIWGMSYGMTSVHAILSSAWGHLLAHENQDWLLV